MKKKLGLFLLLTSICFVSTACANTNNFVKDNKSTLLQEIKGNDYRYSYKDINGNLILKNLDSPLYFEDNEFSNISINGKYGKVNVKGEKILEPLYVQVENFNEDLCAFFVEDEFNNLETKRGFINKKGDIVISPMKGDFGLESGDSYDYDFHNGLALHRSNEQHLFGFINKQGNLSIDTTYEYALPFSENLAGVCSNYKCGFIDKTGKTVIPLQFNDIKNFSENLAAVYDGTKWGYINKQGNYVIKPQFGALDEHEGKQYVSSFENGLAIVYLGSGSYSEDGYVNPTAKQKNHFALIDKTGKIIKTYNFIEPFHNKYKAFSDDKQYILDKAGNVIKELEKNE